MKVRGNYRLALFGKTILPVEHDVRRYLRPESNSAF